MILSIQLYLRYVNFSLLACCISLFIYNNCEIENTVIEHKLAYIRKWYPYYCSGKLHNLWEKSGAGEGQAPQT